jgi:DNA-binding transcriptional LysR family regulator
MQGDDRGMPRGYTRAVRREVRVGTHLSSTQIESFVVLARELNFSRAADQLHITQPALTRRIQALEETLGQMLFLRLRGGLELTESGRLLQRHASSIEHQERELLDRLVGDRNAADGIAGFFRIASFSSSLRSVILPALGVLLRANPRVTCQAIKAEAHALHDMLIDGKIDFCVSLAECERMGVENAQIGVERNILIESTRYPERCDCYIDHEPRDNFTERFFLSQTGATLPTMRRAYFDDIYGLIDAVSAGIGRAVVPVHLIRPEHQVRAVPGYRPFEVPVILQYHGQPYYTRLQRAVIETLTIECAPLLNANRQLGEAGSAVADDALVAANRRRVRSAPEAGT